MYSLIEEDTLEISMFEKSSVDCMHCSIQIIVNSREQSLNL